MSFRYSKVSVSLIVFLTLSSFSSTTNCFASAEVATTKGLSDQQKVCELVDKDGCKSKHPLIVYYSRSGNTKKVAEKLATSLKCDIIEITEPQSRSGIWNLFTAGYDALMKKQPAIIYPEIDYAKYSSIIIGTPIWASLISTPIRSFFKDYSTHNAAAKTPYKIFYTCGGTPHSILEPSIKKETKSIVGTEAAGVVGWNSNELSSVVAAADSGNDDNNKEGSNKDIEAAWEKKVKVLVEDV